MMIRSLIIFICLLFALQNASGQLAGFTLTGNPQSAMGATWTYQDSVNGIWYDLEGILFEPPLSSPPFPAVIINHGTGGNAYGYSKNIAQEMVQWNYVCIATNLCHSGGVPIGSPGDTSFANQGASLNNALRGMKCWDILASLGYVDTNCIMAFGHSRGAYATTGMTALFPDKFSCAGHTSGGAIPLTGYSAPSTTLASQVTCPYIMHHGDADSVVPQYYDSTLNAVFNTTGIPHDYFIYPGLNHPQMSMDSMMLVRTHDWFQNHSCIYTQSNETESHDEPQVIWQTDKSFKVFFNRVDFSASVYNLNGQLISSLNSKSESVFRCDDFKPGVYVVRITSKEKCFVKKIVAY